MNIYIQKKPYFISFSLLFVFNTLIKCQTIDTLFATPSVFADSTTIHFTIGQDDTINLQLLNAQGQLLDSLIPSSILTAGSYSKSLLGNTIGPGIYFIKLDRGASASLTTKVIHTPSTGVFNLSGYQNICFFPNPTNGTLFSTFDGIKKIVVSNLDGKTIESFSTISNEISITNLPSGIFLVSLFDKNNNLIVTQKIILN